MQEIHFIGIKGIAMSGLALIFSSYGFKVSGSDASEYFHTQDFLKKREIPVKKFSAKNINKSIDLIIYSTAYSKEHPERKKAEKLKIPQISYSNALALMFNSRTGIAVTGTHGKTTTSALISYILEKAKFDPTCLVGGILNDWKTTARLGKSRWMVAEADEYQEKFLLLNPNYLVITNIDYEHPDWFKTKKAYQLSFAKFIKNMKPAGKLIMFPEEAKKIKKFIPKKLLILPQKNDYEILEKSNFSLLGKHNEKNALLAVRLARLLKIKEKTIKKTLSDFKGIKRRMEFYTAKNSRFVVIDDYAHNPEKIQALLKTIRDNFKNYFIIAVFQPHTYSRTSAFKNAFSKSFNNADSVIILPVYSSVREKAGLIERRKIEKDFFSAIKKQKPYSSFCKNFKEAKNKIFKTAGIRKNVLVATIGAGNVWQIAESLAKNKVHL